MSKEQDYSEMDVGGQFKSLTSPCSSSFLLYHSSCSLSNSSSTITPASIFTTSGINLKALSGLPLPVERRLHRVTLYTGEQKSKKIKKNTPNTPGGVVLQLRQRGKLHSRMKIRAESQNNSSAAKQCTRNALACALESALEEGNHRGLKFKKQESGLTSRWPMITKQGGALSNHNARLPSRDSGMV